MFDQLFSTAVEQADMRVHAFDNFAVQLHDQPQNTVRCRVLGTEIDRIILDDLITSGGREFGCELGHFCAPFSSPGRM